eukprot:CAMPEP_0204378890 /NCGR_PEP_ID=MMETSP0469-20131031/52165_1 /ASSEMBLY_ACC=CAM_ASM_000384 /TAXON_ID=2969 /ORGANISM="Oxyrrhis marina" /LENGTH=223 /DNA_ID=CAMNT_0051370261 /DNA_START=1 /DNA_END=669 /DNA_ORIENTATION=+
MFAWTLGFVFVIAFQKILMLTVFLPKVSDDAYQLAAAGRHKDLNRLLDEGELALDIDETKVSGHNALHVAVRYSQVHCVVALLTKGAAEVDHRTQKRHHTALHLAAKRNDSAGIVEILLAAQADVNARDARHDTALHFACRRNDEFIVHRLLRAKADPTMANKGGVKPQVPPHILAGFSHSADSPPPPLLPDRKPRHIGEESARVQVRRASTKDFHHFTERAR